MKLSLVTGIVAGVLALAAPNALAVPVTVDLRIEGAARTLFEGPVTTDVRAFNFTGGQPHECDGSGASPQVTSGAVLAEAAERTPFSLAGTWSDAFGSPTFSAVAGEAVAYDPATERYLAEFRNGVAGEVGSCGEVLATGDRVLFAYARFGERPLTLSGPAKAKPGEAVTLKVTDAESGEAIAGAAVGDRLSGADGAVTAGPWSERGDHDLKATKDGAIRSNRVRVCVTDGVDGACGSPLPGAPSTVGAAPDRTAPVGGVLGLSDGHVFARGPRALHGSFAADPSGIGMVKLQLRKRVGKRCWYFSGRREQFRRTPCGTGWSFSIGDRADWTYLLPERLGPGRYELRAEAIDRAGNRTPLRRGSSQVLFKVR